MSTLKIDKEKLIEKRGRFVYESARLAAIAVNAPVIPVEWEKRKKSFKDQFLKAIEMECVENRSGGPHVAHMNWMDAYRKMGWKYGKEYNEEKKTHPDMVSYEELPQKERDKDSVFLALCEIARQWIY